MTDTRVRTRKIDPNEDLEKYIDEIKRSGSGEINDLHLQRLLFAPPDGGGGPCNGGNGWSKASGSRDEERPSNGVKSGTEEESNVEEDFCDALEFIKEDLSRTPGTVKEEEDLPYSDAPSHFDPSSSSSSSRPPPSSSAANSSHYSSHSPTMRGSIDPLSPNTYNTMEKMRNVSLYSPAPGYYTNGQSLPYHQPSPLVPYAAVSPHPSNGYGSPVPGPSNGSFSSPDRSFNAYNVKNEPFSPHSSGYYADSSTNGDFKSPQPPIRSNYGYSAAAPYIPPPVAAAATPQLPYGSVKQEIPASPYPPPLYDASQPGPSSSSAINPLFNAYSQYPQPSPYLHPSTSSVNPYIKGEVFSPAPLPSQQPDIKPERPDKQQRQAASEARRRARKEMREYEEALKKHAELTYDKYTPPPFEKCYPHLVRLHRQRQQLLLLQQQQQQQQLEGRESPKTYTTLEPPPHLAAHAAAAAAASASNYSIKEENEDDDEREAETEYNLLTEEKIEEMLRNYEQCLNKLPVRERRKYRRKIRSVRPEMFYTMATAFRCKEQPIESDSTDDGEEKFCDDIRAMIYKVFRNVNAVRRRRKKQKEPPTEEELKKREDALENEELRIALFKKYRCYEEYHKLASVVPRSMKWYFVTHPKDKRFPMPEGKKWSFYAKMDPPSPPMSPGPPANPDSVPEHEEVPCCSSGAGKPKLSRSHGDTPERKAHPNVWGSAFLELIQPLFHSVNGDPRRVPNHSTEGGKWTPLWKEGEEPIGMETYSHVRNRMWTWEYDYTPLFLQLITRRLNPRPRVGPVNTSLYSSSIMRTKKNKVYRTKEKDMKRYTDYHPKDEWSFTHETVHLVDPPVVTRSPDKDKEDPLICCGANYSDDGYDEDFKYPDGGLVKPPKKLHLLPRPKNESSDDERNEKVIKEEAKDEDYEKDTKEKKEEELKKEEKEVKGEPEKKNGKIEVTFLPRVWENRPVPEGYYPLLTANQYWAKLRYYERDRMMGRPIKIKNSCRKITLNTRHAEKEGEILRYDEDANLIMHLAEYERLDRDHQTTKLLNQLDCSIYLKYVEGGYLVLGSDSVPPIFFQSMMYNAMMGDELDTIVKIEKGHEVIIFDECFYNFLLQQGFPYGEMVLTEIRKLLTCRVSFTKGWGEAYKKPTIKDSLVWIHIDLMNPKKKIDNMVTEMALIPNKKEDHWANIDQWKEDYKKDWNIVDKTKPPRRGKEAYKRAVRRELQLPEDFPIRSPSPYTEKEESSGLDSDVFDEREKAEPGYKYELAKNPVFKRGVKSFKAGKYDDD